MARRCACSTSPTEWAWVKSDLDGMSGYVPEDCGAAPASAATQLVAVPRTFVYRGADLRFPQAFALSMGSRIAVSGEAETRGTRYFLWMAGWRSSPITASRNRRAYG